MQRLTEKPLFAGVEPTGFSPVTAVELDSLVQRIVRALKPEQVILFGSYAYGSPSPDSDVDLLIVWDTEARPVDRYVAVSSLLVPRPFPLDILVKTPEEIATALAQNDFFIHDIITSGKVLYERSNEPSFLGRKS
jgi:uncharacterized protein